MSHSLDSIFATRWLVLGALLSHKRKLRLVVRKQILNNYLSCEASSDVLCYG